MNYKNALDTALAGAGERKVKTILGALQFPSSSKMWELQECSFSDCAWQPVSEVESITHSHRSIRVRLPKDGRNLVSFLEEDACYTTTVMGLYLVAGFDPGRAKRPRGAAQFDCFLSDHKVLCDVLLVPGMTADPYLVIKMLGAPAYACDEEGFVEWEEIERCHHLRRNKLLNKRNAMWKEIRIVQADITTLNVDVIVNSANTGLWAGGGVCGAIHTAAGPELEQECMGKAPCHTGDCCITGAYGISQCSAIIHAVGPIWQGGNCGEAEMLRSAYLKSIDCAMEHGMHSIAFPFICSDIFGYPREQCAEVAFRAIMDRLDRDINITMCAYSAQDYALFHDTYARLKAQLNPE